MSWESCGLTLVTKVKDTLALQTEESGDLDFFWTFCESTIRRINCTALHAPLQLKVHEIRPRYWSGSHATFASHYQRQAWDVWTILEHML